MSDSNNTIIKTKNIQQSMAEYASDNFIPLNECDFTIKSVATYVKTSSDDSFRLFKDNVAEHYDTENKILNQHVEFQQVYTIIATKPTEVKIKLNYSVELGEFAAMPKLILHPNSHIIYKTRKPVEVFKLLVKEFNKIKASHGILINIFDEKMIKNLKAFTKFLYQGKFKKKIRIPLFEGIEPEVTRAGKLILWFKQKETQTKHKIIEVEKDETLVEFKKPIYGKSGFNAFGKQINKDYVDNADDLQTPIDSKSIYIEESADNKLYKSKAKGFVHFSEKLLSVNNKVKMTALSRVEGSLAKEQDNNIEVHVSQNDTTKDSIGEGVKLKSETIHINGHIGANSILEAINLQIDGATHQDSTQFAKFAKINRHKGTLRCHSAKIALLEGGEVHATNVEIEACLGGVVYAQNVTIGHVKSNLKVFASQSITIRLVSGEDNIFKINYKDIPIVNSKIEYIKKDIEDLRFKLEEAHRHNKPNIKELQKQVKELKDKLESIKESTLSAKIDIEQPLKGLNTINFTLNNGDELIYKTDAKAYETFSLVVSEDKITLKPVNQSISL